MTFTEGVLRLVRIGARIDSREGQSAIADAGDPAVEDPVDDAQFAALVAADELSDATESPYLEPGYADLEAAVGLVEAGLATRIVLANFPTWPGLLWRAYQLAGETGVLILPTVVRPGGRVDIVIARQAPDDV